MILSWSDYLRSYTANADYNKNLPDLQSLIPESENDFNSFRHLVDNKFIICLTKGAENEIQATFCHSILRKSFTDKNPTCLALTGFGTRATAVRIAPKEIFFKSSEKKIPPFQDILRCTCENDVTALKGDREKKKVDNYAIIPPFLAVELFDEEEMNPMQVLIRMLKKTTRLIKRPERQEDDDHEDNQSDEVEVLEAEELTDDDLELAPDDPSPVVMDPLYDPTEMEHPLEAGFGRCNRRQRTETSKFEAMSSSHNK